MLITLNDKAFLIKTKNKKVHLHIIVEDAQCNKIKSKCSWQEGKESTYGTK